VLEPLDLVARLVALIPPPRFHMLRYHGVLAAHAKARAEGASPSTTIVSDLHIRRGVLTTVASGSASPGTTPLAAFEVEARSHALTLVAACKQAEVPIEARAINRAG